MSRDLYIGVVVSFEEKGTWAYLAGAVVIPALYFIHVTRQLGAVPVDQVVWVRPLVIAIVAGILVGIASTMLIAITKPSEAGVKDVRDKDISRFGDYVGGIVLSVVVVGVLVLTMLRVEHLWIANAIYAGFVAQAITSSVVKLVAYRRGL
jgi:hypothetical protein